MSRVVSEEMIINTKLETEKYLGSFQESVTDLIFNIKAIQSVIDILPTCFNTSGGTKRYRELSNINFDTAGLENLVNNSFNCLYYIEKKKITD